MYSRALIVREPYATRIVEGGKTWELRKAHTKVRGVVGIVAQGSGAVIGTARITDSLAVPVDALKTLDAALQHCAPSEFVDKYFKGRATACVWTLDDAVKFAEPRRYVAKRGQMVWVLFPADGPSE
uniref:ASCH domain protein n=1 Tax=Marseillevirus LCMAC103 TaxID=2506604 RepID=A0A481YWK1_9VIRU|nr:MAG: ASCH domain protein [Marseillevirus LCMAC103]